MKISINMRVASTQGVIFEDRCYYSVDHVSVDGNMVWLYDDKFRHDVSSTKEDLRRAEYWW